MRKVKNTLTQNAALVEFLTELAKYLISSGVSLSEFQAATSIAFLQAAVGRTRLRNSRVNRSALAAITGLNRNQVRALMHEWESGPPPQSSRLFEILDAWQRDQEFGSRSETDFTLPIRGRQGSFSALIQKYCGDVSYKAFLSQLKKLGYVRAQGSEVALTARGKQQFEPRELRQLARGLAFTLQNNTPLNADLSVFTGEAIYRSPSPKSRILIKKRLSQSTKAFAADIKAAGEAEASKSPRGRGTTRSSIFVLTIDQDDLNRKQTQGKLLP